MTVSYSQERPCEVLRVYKRTGLVSKTILLLGSRAVPAYFRLIVPVMLLRNIRLRGVSNPWRDYTPFPRSR